MNPAELEEAIDSIGRRRTAREISGNEASRQFMALRAAHGAARFDRAYEAVLRRIEQRYALDSGHWRDQPCGPARSRRRPVYIAPYIKGPRTSRLS